MQLNSCQQHAINEIIKFLHSDEKYFNLSGAAGTGKTFLIQYLINNLFASIQQLHKAIGSQSKFHNLAVLATTNKAASVLGSVMQMEVQTVHKFFSLFVARDNLTGIKSTKTTRNSQIQHNYVLFIDEASLIDKELFGLIDRLTMDTKVIFIGDQYQLGPVSQQVSSVYTKNFPIVELKTMERTTAPVLIDLYDRLRDSVRTKQPVQIQTHAGIIEHYDGLAAKQIVKDTFIQPDIDARVVAYSNERVMQWTNFLNQEVFHRGTSLSVGTHLILGKAFKGNTNKRYYSEEEAVITRYLDPAINPDCTLEPIYGSKGTGQRAVVSFRHGASGEVVAVNTIPAEIKRLIKAAKADSDWGKVEALEERVIDLRYREAATTHKTQGSTYDEIFVDLENLSTCHNPNTFYRLLYVACSRAKYKIHLLGELNAKFGTVL